MYINTINEELVNNSNQPQNKNEVSIWVEQLISDIVEKINVLNNQLSEMKKINVHDNNLLKLKIDDYSFNIGDFMDEFGITQFRKWLKLKEELLMSPVLLEEIEEELWENNGLQWFLDEGEFSYEVDSLDSNQKEQIIEDFMCLDDHREDFLEHNSDEIRVELVDVISVKFNNLK